MPITLLRHTTQKPTNGVLKLDLGHELTANLMGCWMMNEYGSTTLNDAVDMNPAVAGTGTATPPWSSGSDPRAGPAISNDGSVVRYYRVASPIGNLKTERSAISLEIFFRSDNNSGGNNHRLVEMADVNWGFLYDSFNGGGGNLCFEMFGANQKVVVLNNTDVTLGVWHHVVGTYDATESTPTMRAYLNGKLYGSTATGWTTTADSSSSAFTILAKFGGATGDSWNGAIAWVRCWNRQLQAADVVSLYIDPFAMFQVRPLQRWLTIPAAANLPPGLGPSMEMDPASQSAQASMMR